MRPILEGMQAQKRATNIRRQAQKRDIIPKKKLNKFTPPID
jgi:hypothetical protein